MSYLLSRLDSNGNCSELGSLWSIGMEQENWALGPACAAVTRVVGRLHVVLRGVVTAQAFELLHLRLAHDAATSRALVVGPAAVLTATNRSLAEAVARGTPAADARTMLLLVPTSRLSWALRHAHLTSEFGVSRQVQVISAWGRPQADAAARGSDRRVH